MALDIETRQQLVDTVRRFVEEKCRPRENEVAETDDIPADILQEMKMLGLFGLTIPEEYGGLDLGMEDELGVCFEMGRTSPAFRSAFGTNVGIGSQGLVMFGSDAQKSKYLPGVASGDIVTSFGLTEPEAGSDSAAVQTRAEFKGDHYVLNGRKCFITNADKASLFTVMARTDPETKGGRGVSAFLVSRDLDGLSIGKSEKKMGQQGAQIADVIFDDVKVPVEDRLGEEGEGFKVAMSVLDKGRIHISGICIGLADRLIEEMVAYASERRQFGKPLIEHQLVAAMIADSQAEYYAARSMALETARARDAGKKVTKEASCTKLYASEMVGRVADRAVQVFGGAGYTEDHGIARFYRDARIFRIYEGTSQIQQIVIARELAREFKNS